MQPQPTTIRRPGTNPIFDQHYLYSGKSDPIQLSYFHNRSPLRLSLSSRVNDLFVITRFVKGSGHCTVDLFPHPVQAGSLFIIHPHSDYSLDIDEEADLEGWTVSIQKDYFRQAGSNLLELIFGLRNISHFPVPKDKGEKLDKLFYFLRTELNTRSPGADPVINAYLTILLSEFNQLSTNSSTGRNLHDPRYDDFLDLVNKDFREIRDVETYAARIHISSKQLSRICKDASGRTPGQLLDRRIHMEASRLLQYTNRSVKEISYELGFGEPSYFIKFYRRISNQTPHQYRQYLNLQPYNHN